MNGKIGGMNELLNELPESAVGLESVRTDLLKSLASERITGTGILSSYMAAQRRGLTEDSGNMIFEKIPQLTYSDLKLFHNDNISRKPYIYCVLGEEKDRNQDHITALGKITKLSLNEIFGY